MDWNRLQICILVPDVCQMLLLYSIWLVPVFPRGWSTHLDSPDGRADRLIKFFLFFYAEKHFCFIDLGCAITVEAKGKAGDHRRSWAAHTPVWGCVRIHPSPVSHSNAATLSERERAGRREIRQRLSLSWTTPTPQKKERLWPRWFPRSRWCQRRIPERTQTRGGYGKTSASHSGGGMEPHGLYFAMHPSFWRKLQKQQLHCGENAAR